MTSLQKTSLAAATLLVLVLYFAFATKPRERSQIDKSRTLVAEHTDANALLQKGYKKISPAGLSNIQLLEQALDKASADTTKISLLKQLSSVWYAEKQFALAGSYAEKIAQEQKSEETWSVAGTTFFAGINQTEDENESAYCFDHAVKAFQNAISLNPSNTQARINLALTYVEKPLPSEPMKGIMMLLDLNKQHPNDVNILNQLGRLGIKTKQYEKAVERLKKSLSLQPENQTTLLLLMQVSEAMGKQADFQEYKRQYEQLIK